MSTEKPVWASLVVYFGQWLFKEPSHVIYIMPIWKRWLLERFYGLRFWPIFDFSWNSSHEIHLLTIGWYWKPFDRTWPRSNSIAELEWHDFGWKKVSKNSIVAPTLKSSPAPSHFIFEINVGKSRIRYKTTLKLNDEFRNRLKIYSR